MNRVPVSDVPELLALGLDPSTPFTWEHAKARGANTRLLGRLMEEGLLRRWFRSVYVHHGNADDVLARARALSLVLPPRSVVVDRSAAWLLGVDATLPWEREEEPRLEVFRSEAGARLRRSQCSSGERELAAGDVTATSGVRHTTALRTALDLGRLLGRDRALAAMDGLLRVGRIGQPDLQRELVRFRGYRGVVQLRSLASVADPLAESPGESRLRLSWLDAGLPRPRLQHRVMAQQRTAYLDIADPSSKFAAEYDGEDWHSSPEQRTRDEDRRRWLRSLGWHVEVFTKADYARGGPVPEVRMSSAYRRVMTRRSR